MSKIDGEFQEKKHKIEIKNENESMSYDMAHHEIEEEEEEDQQTEQSMVISTKIVDHCAQEVETSLTSKTLTISQSSGLAGVKRRRRETKLVNQKQLSADTPSQVTSSFSSSNQNYLMQTPSAPKTKDLVVKAVESLPNQVGTKEEIIEMIDVLCPTFCLPKTGAFKRTFDQALSKYLLANDAQIMLIASQYDIDREMCQKGVGD